MNSLKKNLSSASSLLALIVTSIFILSILSGCGASSNSPDEPNDRTNDAEGAVAEVESNLRNNEEPDQTPFKRTKKNLKEVETGKWTVLVYLMGDTDLEEFALYRYC